MSTINKIKSTASCYHCGENCNSETVHVGEKLFCCNGCKTVYEILNANDMCSYYSMNQQPGINVKNTVRKDKFQFLDNPEIIEKLIQFSDNKKTQLTLYLPQIHCSSCLWLLENLHILNDGIINTNVNFAQKEIFIVFDNQKITLRNVVETLTQLGYEPHLSLNDVSTKSLLKIDRTRWYKIGVAGFAFGNIMMISFADYLAKTNAIEPKIAMFFKGFSILLALPVLFYSASEFFASAWSGIKNKILNVDFPVALALVICFSRSIFEIVNGTGYGYLDSMSGIVFFMLIGRWLQNRTYQTISFDRDYKSFFPIALNIITNGIVISKEIVDVEKNDEIQIHHAELIPVDAILSKGIAKIDYSFVSGESEPVTVQIGEIIYAGGKQLEGMIELIVLKEVSQSYLTNLWNSPIFSKKQEVKKSIYDSIAKYFTYLVIVIAVVAGLYWNVNGSTKLMWNAFTTVLIVACPCALLLSQSYTQGNILRIFGLNKFYLRSADIIDKLAEINHIVLDKTGTLTQTQQSNVRYAGKILNEETKKNIASLLNQSSHPASKAVFNFLNEKNIFTVQHFKEIFGSGIEGWINESYIKIGSPEFVTGSSSEISKGTKVVVKIDNEIIGEFTINNKYRFGVTKLLQTLKKQYTLSLISGDNDSEIHQIEELIGKESGIYFNQSPQQKLSYIQELQDMHHLQVLMVGDGLNDAGALKQSDVGIAVADSGNSFTPSSDGIIEGATLQKLNKFLLFAKASKKIIFATFAVSVLYNIIGLYYAVQGNLSPVVAAILMPLSSITIILLTFGLSELIGKKYLKN